jgi:hypothetical protein
MFPILRQREHSARCDEFHSLVRLLMLNRGRVGNAKHFIESHPVSPRVADIITRAAPGSLDGLGNSPPSWGGIRFLQLNRWQLGRVLARGRHV